jgi:hypothetical protein
MLAYTKPERMIAMREFTPVQKSFNELWNSGYRFLSDDDKNSMRNGYYANQNGRVSGFTINGLHPATIGGIELTPEEIEMGVNYIKFLRALKR